MKKHSLKKLLLSCILLASTFVPAMFMVSCSAATSQINAPVKIITNNKFLGDKYTFTPGSQSTFKNNGANLDSEKDSLFFDYWANIIAPSYALSSSAVNVDSSKEDSKFLSEDAAARGDRDASFNYAVSNSWVSGSNIYVGDEYRFKLMPDEINLTIAGDIIEIDKDTILNSSNIKNEVTMTNLSIRFSFYDINDGVENKNAIKELEKIFPGINFKSQYTVSLKLSSKTTYEILNQKDDKPVELPQEETKFDPSTMKVKVTNKYHISDLNNMNENNEIDISKDLSLFKDWYLNPNKIDKKYENLITSIK